MRKITRAKFGDQIKREAFTLKIAQERQAEKFRKLIEAQEPVTIQEPILDETAPFTKEHVNLLLKDANEPTDSKDGQPDSKPRVRMST